MASNASEPHAKASNECRVKQVVLGNLLFQTWFQSIYPEEFVSKDANRLYVCRWCFRYSTDVDAYAKHACICENRMTPLGVKVYDDGGYSVWKVDGEDHKLYCQNLSLFAKLFLDHKSVFFDVALFVYYILTFTDPTDPKSYHTLGYFSKEKMSWDTNNLACILIFPPYQHKQLGKLLMGISYKLSCWEMKGGFIGGPERPLSEMGSRSYSRFWKERVVRYLLMNPHVENADGTAVEDHHPANWNAPKRPHHKSMTIQQIGLATGMLTEDVITALEGLGVVEPDKTCGKRTNGQSSLGEHSPGVDDSFIIRKSNLLEWAKIHLMSLQDPVRHEKFVGEWTSGELFKSVNMESSEDLESSKNDMNIC